MRKPILIPLLRGIGSWLGLLLFQLVLVLLYSRYLLRDFRSPFRAAELPRLRPPFWPYSTPARPAA